MSDQEFHYDVWIIGGGNAAGGNGIARLRKSHDRLQNPLLIILRIGILHHATTGHAKCADALAGRANLYVQHAKRVLLIPGLLRRK